MVKINQNEMKQLQARVDVQRTVNGLLQNEFNSYLLFLGEKYEVKGKFHIDEKGEFISE